MLEELAFHLFELLLVEIIPLPEHPHEFLILLDLLFFLLELIPEPAEFLLDIRPVPAKDIQSVLDLVLEILLVVLADRTEILFRLLLKGVYFLFEMLVAYVDLMGDLSDHLGEVAFDVGL